MADIRPKTSRTRGTSERGERSRTAILEAARHLFADRGYRGTSMASVAAAVDLTQPGLLHHFPSKEALLHELLAERYHDDGQRLKEGLARDDAGLLAALERIIHHNLSSEEGMRLFSVLVAEGLSPDHPAHDYFVERYEKVRQRMATSLSEDQQAGRMPEDLDVEATAAVIVAVMDGLQTQWLLDPRVDMVRAFHAFAQALDHVAAGTAVAESSDGSAPRAASG